MKLRTRLMLLAGLIGLAACGANGEPVRPSVNAGVSVSNRGVHTSTSVGFNLGGVTVGLGVGG